MGRPCRGTRSFYRHILTLGQMYQRAVQMPPCALLASPLVRAVLANISRSQSNLGVHLRPHGCATAPTSPVCLVPRSRSPSLGSSATATCEQGRESSFHLQPTEMTFLGKTQLFPSTLCAFVPIAAGWAQPRWFRLRQYLPHPPLSPKASGTGGNCLSSLAVKGREIFHFSW